MKNIIKPSKTIMFHELIFMVSIDNVERLLKISTEQKHRDDAVLVKNSSIVYLVAIWQHYVQTLVEHTFEQILSKTKDPMKFPMKLLTIASSEIYEDKNKTRVWEIANDGWIKVLKQHADKCIKNFNTPDANKIDILFEKVIGIKNISYGWKWRGLSNKNACDRLNYILKIRHDIAHKGRTKSLVYHNDIVTDIHFIHRLAVSLNNSVVDYSKEQFGLNIWHKLKYKDKIGEFETRAK